MKKAILPAVLVLLSIPALRARWAWERAGRMVTLCVDGAELEALVPADAFPAAMASLDKAGVRSVGVLWDGTESPAETCRRWSDRLPAGWTITLRPHMKKFSEGGRPFPDGDFPIPASVRYLLPSGLAMTAARPPEALFALAEGEVLLPIPDVARPQALERLARRAYPRVLRAHSVDEEEMLRLSPQAVHARFLRAVKERGVRFLYLRFFPTDGAAANMSRVSALGEALRREGFVPGTAESAAPSPRPFDRRWPLFARSAVAFLLASLAPWLFFRSWLDGKGTWWGKPLSLFVLSLTAALAVAAALSSGEFLLGLETFRGVKAALVLPLLLAAGDLFSRGERAALLKRPLSVGAAAGWAALGLAALVYVLRSGHESGLGASALELRVRDILEALFGVRPRFKEFAVGWPLLWAGCWSAARRKKPFGMDPRAFLLAGFVAPLSVVNAFCHAHVPLPVSLLRAFHGFWLGSAAGLLLIRALSLLPPQK